MNDGAVSSRVFGGNPGEPVPEVDPEDLKVLWLKQQELQARHPGQQMAIGMDLVQRICKPGADIPAIGYRVSMLWLLSQIAPVQFATFMRDGQLIDTAFRAAATVPVKWVGEGITDQSPFDVGEFLRLCSET
ncbi:MAG: hypothetical protein WAK13_00610 [Terriglobales bacterium]